jgi:hypothetical protein
MVINGDLPEAILQFHSSDSTRIITYAPTPWQQRLINAERFCQSFTMADMRQWVGPAAQRWKNVGKAAPNFDLLEIKICM